MQVFLLLLPLLLTTHAANYNCKETTKGDFEECLQMGFSPTSKELAQCSFNGLATISKNDKKACNFIQKQVLECPDFKCEILMPPILTTDAAPGSTTEPILGAWRINDDETDMDVITTVDAAAAELFRRAGPNLAVVRGPVTQVEEQVVAGMNYKITILMGITENGDCAGVADEGVVDFRMCAWESLGHYVVNVRKMYWLEDMYEWGSMENIAGPDLAGIWNKCCCCCVKGYVLRLSGTAFSARSSPLSRNSDDDTP